MRSKRRSCKILYKLESFYRAQKRPILLLEVLIALMLIIICAIPLISPHVTLMRAQQSVIASLETDRQLNLLYVDLLERMHSHEINWSNIESQNQFPIDTAFLERVKIKSSSFPYNGNYRFQVIKFKANKTDGWHVCLVKVTFTLASKDLQESDLKAKKEKTFSYEMVVLRHVPVAEGQSEEEAKKKT